MYLENCNVSLEDCLLSEVILPDTNISQFDPEPYPDFTQITSVRLCYIVVFLIVMTFAVLGNAIVCTTVFSNRKMHTAVNYYIVNLAVCDFMVGIFVLPVKLLELTAPAEWGILNDGLCTAMMYLQTIFVFASVLTLVAICIERYMAVIHPLESRMQQTKSRAKRILLVVWFLPCVVAIPFLYPSQAFSNTLQSDFGTISRLTCFISLPEEIRRAYYTFLFVFIYLMPLSFIGGTCCQVARCLLKDIPAHRQGSIRRQETNRRKVAKMVMMVVLAFVVNWTPYFLVSIITQYQAVNFMERENFFFTMLNINLFAFANSCVNPFIYASMSTRFRNGFLRFFRAVCMLGLCSPTDAETELKSIAATKVRGPGHVRFQCQVPMSCLVTQSSTESGSGINSDASQRTACTSDVSNRRLTSTILRILRLQKKHSTRVTVQYINSKIDQCTINGLKTGVPNDLEKMRDIASETRASTSSLPFKTCSSMNDICALKSSLEASFHDSAIRLKKWSSYLDVPNARSMPSNCV
ncbi:QRFP-like peptide receptor [Uloborus diversus]|uniref:QRFP-like peptide receptor n=1 Tax=Uloborus diversus TaxID=327109 RepID=UPI002409DD9E|nr:QRFP-like peptide receptor [Uloborus diversus]